MPETRPSTRPSSPLAAAGRLAVAATLALAVPRPLCGQDGDTLRLDLATAVRMAAERSARVELGRLASREAEARVEEERSSLLPHLTVDASHGRRTFNTASFGLEFPSPPGEEPLFDPDGEVVGPVETVDLRGRLSQTLFDWSALQKIRSARASRDAARVDEDEAREEAAAGAAAAWVRAERAQRGLEAREEDVALAEQLLGDARELLDAGVGVRLDVTRARAQLATARAGLVGARSEAERSRLALKRALNLPLDRPVVLADRWPEPPAGPAPEEDADTAVAGALGRRPDLLALDQRIDAAQLDLAAVDAERLPTLSLAVGDGFTGAGYDHLLNTYEWVVRVSVPVFTGKARGARSEAEQARVATLEARREELARQVAFNVRDALLGLRASRELVEASRTRLSLAEDEVSQARERFAAGVSGSADLFNATLRLNEARTAVVDALAGWHAARVSLAAAEGAVTELR